MRDDRSLEGQIKDVKRQLDLSRAQSAAHLRSVASGSPVQKDKMVFGGHSSRRRFATSITAALRCRLNFYLGIVSPLSSTTPMIREITARRLLLAACSDPAALPGAIA